MIEGANINSSELDPRKVTTVYIEDETFVFIFVDYICLFVNVIYMIMTCRIATAVQHR